MKQIYSTSSLTLGTKFLSNTTKTLLILFSLLAFTGNAWGNSVSNNGTGALQNGKIVINGNHASFNYAPSSGSFKDKDGITGLVSVGYYYIKVGKNSTTNVTLSWSCNGGQSIKVTAVSFKVKLASGGRVTFNGTTQDYNWRNNPRTCSASNSNGLTSGMTLALTNTKNGWLAGDIEFQIDDISFTYTITPNKPGLSETTKTVNVTLPANTANPTTVNYKVFTTADHFGDYWNYAFSSNPNNKGVMSGDNFYATEAGTYKIHAKINALNNCHTESDWSDDLTITVNRLKPELKYNDGTKPVTIIDTDKQTIDLNSLRTKYTGNGTTFTYAIKSGTGGHLIDNDQKFYADRSDEFIITATSQQTGQYESVSTDFKIVITKRQPEVITAPTATFLVYPEVTLSGSTINSKNDGVVKVGNVDVAGTFAWKTPTTAAERGWHAYKAEFTPTNDNWYEKAECDVYVQVKYAPEITTNTLSGSQIVYGQTLASSNISGTLVATDKVKNPNETVYGTYAWKDNTLKLDANDNASAKVVFTPSNDTWYVPTEFDVPLTVAKANPTIAVTATIVEGQALSEVEFVNATTGVFGEKVTGDITWADNDKKALTPEVGTTEFAINFASTNNNYNSGFGVCAVTVNPGLVFNGGTWTTGSNWSGGEVPVATDRVIVDADGTISTPVEVTALTINAGKTLTIADGGKLTVGVGNSLTRDNYGNIIVEAGGQLILAAGNVEVNDFTLYSTFVGGNPKSGQVTGAEQLNAHGEAYFALDLDPDGVATYGWYSFTVPFQVNAMSGVEYFKEGSWHQMVNEQNYAIMDYHEDLRAQGKYGWKKYRSILQPNTGYIITVDDELGINTVRFRKEQSAVFNTEMTQQLTATVVEGGAVADKGWNYIGNGTTSYINYGSTTIYAQVLDHAANVYNISMASSNTMVVGAAYVVQAANNTTLTMVSANETTTGLLRAPERETISSDAINISLRADQKTCDRLFITYGDEAAQTYTIGKDVKKMGTTSGASVARMWANAKGEQLAAVDMAFADNQVIVPLSLYAPATADFSIALADYPAEDVYLLHNGSIIADLTFSDHSLTLNAGTDNSYALLIVRRVSNVATGVDNMHEDANRGTDFVEKIMVNGQLYILRNGTLYDVQGRKATKF